MATKISPRILAKIAERGITPAHIEECFTNRTGGTLLDTREQHKTNPPTQWFIALTDKGRRLKIVFMQDGGDVELKSAFDPNITEMYIYAKHGS